jgi:hypothetical protein
MKKKKVVTVALSDIEFIKKAALVAVSGQKEEMYLLSALDSAYKQGKIDQLKELIDECETKQRRMP